MERHATSGGAYSHHKSSGGSSSHRSNNSCHSSSSHQLQSLHRPKTAHQQERGIDLVCRVKYGNTLPDLPFEPKFLQSPFISLSRFINYKPSTVEKNFKYELLTEPDLNVKIDLIDPMTYCFNSSSEKLPIDPIDEQLLEDESLSQLNTRRSIQHRKVVPWMRKTEYISTEFNRYGVGQTGAERPDTKIGYGTKKRIKEEPFEYKDRNSQIAAVLRTFEDVKKPARRHYNKPNVTAMEEMPILPDFDLWKYPFAQVIFDADPLPYSKQNREQKLTHAILRGMADTEGNQFVGYFAPSDEALEQLIVDDGEEPGDQEDGKEYQYCLEREYNWTVQNKATKGYEQENYFLALRGSVFYYSELETRVKLTRRVKGTISKNTVLAVTNRPLNSKESSAMMHRTNALYGIQEEEAEEQTDGGGPSNERQGDDEDGHSVGSSEGGEKRRSEAAANSGDGPSLDGRAAVGEDDGRVEESSASSSEEESSEDGEESGEVAGDRQTVQSQQEDRESTEKESEEEDSSESEEESSDEETDQL